MSDTQQAEVVEGQADTVEVTALLTHDINHVWHVLTTNDGAAALLVMLMSDKGLALRITFLLVGIWFGNKAWYRQRIVIPGSVIIALIGGFWFIQRTTGLWA